MSEHVQRIVRGTPRVAAAVQQSVQANPAIGFIIVIFALTALPVAVLTFVVGAYLSGEEKVS